jgi:SOS regulatory protein LexA
MPQDAPQRIIAFYNRYRRLPSYREILQLTGLRSTQSAQRIVHHMIEAGLVTKDRAGKLIPGRAFKEIRMIGTVRAGWPSPAEEETVDTMDLDEYLIEKKEATAGFSVVGDSMIDAGIMEGDLALIERGRTPKDGQVVLAEVDGELTLKTYHKKGTVVRLEPANKAYPVIYPKEKGVILGVMVAVVRKCVA